MQTHWFGKNWHAYGTSMTMAESGTYAAHLAKLSGLNLVNHGTGGQGITASIGGYSTQGAIRKAVMTLDDGKAEADLITLEVGPNDTGAPLGSIYDTGEDTFCGCLNQCIRYLQANTNAQIVVMSMHFIRYYPLTEDLPPVNIKEKLCPHKDPYTRLEMVEAIRKVCALNSVPYIPVAEECGLGLSRMGPRGNNTYIRDQIHHTQLGGYNVAQFIWSRLKDIPLWYSELPEEAK